MKFIVKEEREMNKVSAGQAFNVWIANSANSASELMLNTIPFNQPTVLNVPELFLLWESRGSNQLHQRLEDLGALLLWEIMLIVISFQKTVKLPIHL